MTVMERFRLDGRTALVSGGSRGIGLAIGAALAEAGARVGLVSRGGTDLDNAVASITETDGQAQAFTTDIGDRARRRELIPEVVAAFGRLDILVNNAAAKPTLGPLSDVPDEVWDTLFEVNVTAYHDLARQAVTDMAERGWGRIINITSATGLKARRNMGEYGITKAAEIMLTRQLAVEHGRKGITANALAPILMRTDFSERQFRDADGVERVVSMQAIDRMGEPSDLQGAALLLASDAGSFITGVTIPVDGGALA